MSLKGFYKLKILEQPPSYTKLKYLQDLKHLHCQPALTLCYTRYITKPELTAKLKLVLVLRELLPTHYTTLNTGHFYLLEPLIPQL
jgi:hypothetical protein